eukprot:350193-Chlamydomonas_euryale.AAC.4
MTPPGGARAELLSHLGLPSSRIHRVPCNILLGLEAVGSGLEAVGSGLEAVGSGLEAVGSGLEAVGSGLEAVGSGLEAVGTEDATV